MISDRDIWRAANLLIREHRADAEVVAARRADEMFERGDRDAQLVRIRIGARSSSFRPCPWGSRISVPPACGRTGNQSQVAAAGHYHTVRGAVRSVVPRSLFGRLARVARQIPMDGTRQGFGAPLLGRPSPLWGQDAWDPRASSGLRVEETIHQKGDPFRKGRGLFLGSRGPVSVRDGRADAAGRGSLVEQALNGVSWVWSA
jgi:hypothetical protein